MASTEELRQLVLHAANRLDEVDIEPLFRRVFVELVGQSQSRGEMTAAYTEAVAAIALASGVLRMTAACMAVDGPGGEP